MGRHSTQPTVEDTGYAFVITRVLDPDDEFAERQVLCRAEGENSLTWQPWDYVYGYTAMEWASHPQATMALRCFEHGFEEGLEEARRRIS